MQGKPRRLVNALLPLAVVILGVLLGIVFSGLANLPKGEPRGLKDIFSNGDSFSALLWAGAAGSLTVGLLVIFQRILSSGETLETWVEGVRMVMEPCLILILAWSLGEAMIELQTPAYINSVFDGLDVRALPCVTFLIGAVISFCTGSAWGTMAILYPLILPLAWNLGEQVGIDTLFSLLLGSYLLLSADP